MPRGRNASHQNYFMETILNDLKWLEAYDGQSTDDLIALEGEYRTDSIVLAFEMALDQKESRVGEAGLSDEERVVQAVEALEREVNNGGYGQFFTNTSHAYAPVIVDALARIGCREAAEITQAAIDAVGLEGPMTSDAIEDAMENDDESRDEKLVACNNRYYETVGDLSEPLQNFIKASKDKIVLAG